MMSLQQYKLFEYTKASELLTGSDVIEADKTKKEIKLLQKQGRMMKDWNLDIYYRDKTIIKDVIIKKINPTSPAIVYGRYTISVEIEPLCIKGYAVPIIFVQTQKEAMTMLEPVRAYLRLRYGA